jgi:hypothetical protein
MLSLKHSLGTATGTASCGVVGGVEAAVTFHHTFNTYFVFSFFPIYGAWLASQLDGLGDGRESRSNG